MAAFHKLGVRNSHKSNRLVSGQQNIILANIVFICYHRAVLALVKQENSRYDMKGTYYAHRVDCSHFCKNTGSHV